MELLGHMVSWSIHKGPYAAHKVADRFAESGFEVEIGEQTEGNAWRRATSENLGTYTVKAASGRLVEVRLEKQDVVMQRRKTNVRSWTRIGPGVPPVEVMRSDLSRKVRPHNKVGSATRLIARNLLPGEREPLEKIKAALDARIDTLMTDLDGSKVRSAVRRTLEGELQAVPMRAAVYFVPLRHTQRLAVLEEVFDVLEGSYCDVFPLLRNEKMVSRVTSRILGVTADDVRDFEAAYRANVKQGRVSEHIYAKAEREAGRIEARTLAYMADLRLAGEAAETLFTQGEALQANLEELARCRVAGEGDDAQ